MLKHSHQSIGHAPREHTFLGEKRNYNNSINKVVYFPSQRKTVYSFVRVHMCVCVCVRFLLVHKGTTSPHTKHTDSHTQPDTNAHTGAHTNACTHTHTHTQPVSHHLWRNNGIIYIFSPARGEASKFSAVISCLCALPLAITVCGVFLLLACPVS